MSKINLLLDKDEIRDLLNDVCMNKTMIFRYISICLCYLN